MSHDTGLYFAQFPRNFDRLQAVLVSVQNGRECSTSSGSQFYREIIFTEPDLLMAPQPDEHEDKVVILAESHVLTSSSLSTMLEKFSLKIIGNVPLTRNLFLYCFEFVLKHRLAPFWNKIGSYYIKGRDFLQEKGKMCAIQIGFSLTDKITISLKAQMLKLPPHQIEDCGISPNIMEQFNHSNSFLIHGHSLENNKCLVLPSLKTGYINCIAHRNIENFDFKRYWKVMYGFRIPDSQPQDIFYSVCFFAGSKTFLYPGYCIRSKEPLVYLRCDQKAILSSFIDDLSSRLPSICGTPFKFTSSSLYPTKTLSSAAVSKQTNLTRTIRPSNSSEKFVFTGNHRGNSEKTAEKSTVSSPKKSNTISPPEKTQKQREASRGAVSCYSGTKPYVPCFTKQNVSRIVDKIISQNAGESNLRRVKPIVPCFMRKPSKTTDNSRNSTINNPGATKIRTTRTENEVMLSGLSDSNVNNGESTVRHSAAGPATIDQYNRMPIVNHTRETISHTTTKKRANPQLKRNEKKPEANIDVRKMAAEHKLSKVKAAVLTKWLKSEGVHCKSKDKKADLLLKVYGHLGQQP